MLLFAVRVDKSQYIRSKLTFSGSTIKREQNYDRIFFVRKINLSCPVDENNHISFEFLSY